MKQPPAGTLQNYFIPTAQMQAGNFTPAYLASLGTGFATKNGSANITGANCANTCPFPTGQIPTSQLDPNSAAILKLMPAPTIDPTTSPIGANYSYFNGPPVNRYELRLRGDYNVSDRTKLFFSWDHQLEHDQNPISIWWQIGGSLPYPSAQNDGPDRKSTRLNSSHLGISYAVF